MKERFGQRTGGSGGIRAPFNRAEGVAPKQRIDPPQCRSTEACAEDRLPGGGPMRPVNERTKPTANIQQLATGIKPLQ